MQLHSSQCVISIIICNDLQSTRLGLTFQNSSSEAHGIALWNIPKYPFCIHSSFCYKGKRQRARASCAHGGQSCHALTAQFRAYTNTPPGVESGTSDIELEASLFERGSAPDSRRWISSTKSDFSEPPGKGSSQNRRNNSRAPKRSLPSWVRATSRSASWPTNISLIFWTKTTQTGRKTSKPSAAAPDRQSSIRGSTCGHDQALRGYRLVEESEIRTCDSQSIQIQLLGDLSLRKRASQTHG